MAIHVPDPRLASLSERSLIAATLYGEARGEPIEGQVGVLHVFRNRVADGRWGPTYHRVLLGWAQFSCNWPGLSSPKAFDAVVAFGQHVEAGGGGSSLKLRQLLGLTDLLLADALADNTRTSTHYYALTPQLIQSPPKWAKPPAILTAQLGNHVFFKAVA